MARIPFPRPGALDNSEQSGQASFKSGVSLVVERRR